MKTKLEIIDETVKYYSEDISRRAVLDMGCYYWMQGKMCAVGRCLIDPEAIQKLIEEKGYGDTDVGTLSGVTDFQSSLKEEYRGHDLNFWKSLQIFHDENSNWCESGLTESGLIELDSLKKRYS